MFLESQKYVKSVSEIILWKFDTKHSDQNLAFLEKFIGPNLPIIYIFFAVKNCLFLIEQFVLIMV